MSFWKGRYYLMAFIAPLVFFLLANGTTVLLSKRKFGACIPLTMMLSAFFMYLSQLFANTFLLGLVMCGIYAFAFIVYLIIKRDRLKEFCQGYFSGGFYVFVLSFVTIFIYNMGRSFGSWDEFSPWGIMIKEMLRLDKLYSVAESTLMVHKDYPPSIQMFEMLWLKLCGGYSETDLVRALHMLELSFCLPFIEKSFDCKKLFNSICSAIVMLVGIVLLVALFDVPGVLNSIYTDYPMAFVIAYAIASVIFEEDKLSAFSIVNLTVTLSFLLLIKQIAIVFFLMTLFVFVIDLYFERRIVKQGAKNAVEAAAGNAASGAGKADVRKMAAGLAVLVIVPVIFWIHWSMYCKTLALDAQFKVSDIALSQFWGIVQGTAGEDWQYATVQRFLDALFTYKVTISHLLPVGYLAANLIIMAIIWLLGWFYKDVITKHRRYLLMVAHFCGTLGYAFVMLALYVFCFGSVEGPALASYDRYMSTYCMMMGLLVMMCLCARGQKQRFGLVKVAALVVGGMLIVKYNHAFLWRIIPFPNDTVSEYEICGDFLTENVEDTAKVYLVSQENKLEYIFFVKYYANPIQNNTAGLCLLGETPEEALMYFHGGINEYMQGFDYLYLVDIDSAFQTNWAFMFGDYPIEAGMLYKINEVDNMVSLTPIATNTMAGSQAGSQANN